jgi:hypothetical protein
MTPTATAASVWNPRMARGERSARSKPKRAGARKKKCWSQSVGEYGLTVRVYELYPGSNLYRSVWVAGRDGEEGREAKKTLGHKDRDRAIREAYELIAHLRSASDGVRQGEITLGVLMTRYLASRKHAAKKERTANEDERKLRRVVEFLGATRKAASLDEEEVLEFVEAPPLPRVSPSATARSKQTSWRCTQCCAGDVSPRTAPARRCSQATR